MAKMASSDHCYPSVSNWQIFVTLVISECSLLGIQCACQSSIVGHMEAKFKLLHDKIVLKSL